MIKFHDLTFIVRHVLLAEFTSLNSTKVVNHVCSTVFSLYMYWFNIGLLSAMLAQY